MLHQFTNLSKLKMCVPVVPRDRGQNKRMEDSTCLDMYIIEIIVNLFSTSKYLLFSIVHAHLFSTSKMTTLVRVIMMMRKYAYN